jgi:hypothetical protein
MSPPYHVYLLRLWRERPSSPEHPAVWRFSVEDARARQRRGFTSLEDLVAFLRVLVEAGSEPREQGGEI